MTKTANAPKSSKKGPQTPESKPKAKKKKEKVEKVDFPGLLDDKGEARLLEEWPEDFDSSKHKTLKKTHFKCESIWYFHQADIAEARAKKLREEGEEAKKLGSSKDAAKAKKLLTMLKKSEELKEQLKAAGVNVEELLTTSNDE